MTYPLVVIGAGGFGRETLDVVAALGEAGGGPVLLGVVDDLPSDGNLQHLRDRGVPYLGTVSSWLARGHSGERFVIAVGKPEVRRELAEAIGERRIATTLIHPRAIIGTMSRFGPGTIVCAGVLVSTNVHCGAHTHLNPGSVIGHDAVVGNFVSVNPGAIVSGSTDVQDEVLVGAGATILQALSIGGPIDCRSRRVCDTRRAPRRDHERGACAMTSAICNGTHRRACVK